MIVAAFAAFLPAIRAPFVFDDVGSIPGNPTIEHVFPLSTSLNPPPRVAVSGRPVVNLSLAVDHAMSASLGLDAESETLVYRVTNVLLHVLCGLLLFGVIRRTMSLARLGAWANSSADTVALVSTATLARAPDPERSGGLRHPADGAPRLGAAISRRCMRRFARGMRRRRAAERRGWWAASPRAPSGWQARK